MCDIIFFFFCRAICPSHFKLYVQVCDANYTSVLLEFYKQNDYNDKKVLWDIKYSS